MDKNCDVSRQLSGKTVIGTSESILPRQTSFLLNETSDQLVTSENTIYRLPVGTCMPSLPVEIADTVLTERQARILALRADGYTQAEIADELGTTTANISAIESSARANITRANRTITAAQILQAKIRFTVSAGTTIRELTDRVYEAGNNAELKISYPSADLSELLRQHLRDRLDASTLTESVAIGISTEGNVVVHPSDLQAFAFEPAARRPSSQNP